MVVQILMAQMVSNSSDLLFHSGREEQAVSDDLKDLTQGSSIMSTWRNMKPFFLKEASNVIAIESLGVNLQISVSSYACRPEQHIKTSMRICNEVKRMWKGHATSSQLHPEAWSWRKSNALPGNAVGKGGVVKPAGTEAQETHGLPNFLEIVPVDGESGEWQNPWGITGSFVKRSSHPQNVPVLELQWVSTVSDHTCLKKLQIVYWVRGGQVICRKLAWLQK